MSGNRAQAICSDLIKKIIFILQLLQNEEDMHIVNRLLA